MSYRRAQSAGFSLLEVVIAAAIFLIFSSGVILLILQALSVERQSANYLKAVSYAEEAREAVRFMRKSSYANLGTVVAGGIASDGYDSLRFDGSPNTVDQFERRITVSDENDHMKRVEIMVTWPVAPEVVDSITLTDYLFDWQLPY